MSQKTSTHRLVTYAKFTPEEVFKFARKKSVTFNITGTIITVPIDKQKLRLFKRSRVCVVCGLVGQYFLLQQVIPSKQHTSHTRYGACYVENCMRCHPYGERKHEPHFNLYGVRPLTDNEVLMTRDHKIPKSRGGTNQFANLQTMCEKCNLVKSNELQSMDDFVRGAERHLVWRDYVQEKS